ncbi:hypothetical protein FB45DRAFT_929190 [Roridomyces roridus]|uniref:Phospholipid/glycerol acyltransferase domain-containing protein n=1 Tax=Roridomyces roridus TaxID=1738132 RepID=A0AAD7BIE9_9AGAR|nr:hypothetical protein FB45DRAFT_929190 [Roridomyces roridus]
MLFWRIVTGIFFREIRSRGSYNIPKDGPVIFVGAPHHNQFLDLLLGLEVYKESGRRVQFLVAASSMTRKFIGFWARLINSIPVERAADSAKPGTVIGEGTRFTSDFKPRMQVMLPKSLGSASAEVLEIISDTELKIKKEFSTTEEKITDKFTEAGAVDFRKLPFVDQQEMDRHVYDCLNRDGSIGIFPEGGSHDRTDLLPLKAGVSIMALGAATDDDALQSTEQQK